MWPFLKKKIDAYVLCNLDNFIVAQKHPKQRITSKLKCKLTRARHLNSRDLNARKCSTKISYSHNINRF